jgi:hypothetical protein
MRKAENLLLILQSYAPDNLAQSDCSVEYFKMVDDGAQEDDLVLTLSELIATGLRDGKWPWS